MILGFYYEHGDGNVWRDCFAERAPEIEFRDWPHWEPCDEVDYALVWAPPPGSLNRCKNLKGVLSLAAGVEHLLPHVQNLPSDVVVIRLADHSLVAGMTEYVVMNVLLHHRRHLDYVAQQRGRHWRQRNSVLAQDRRVGFMGLGNMARPAAEILLQMGFVVSAWTRLPRKEQNIKCYAGRGELREFLRNVDILVALLPLTDETTALLDRETLAFLPRGAALINAGRGRTIVEADLLDALDSGHLGGASLDVFADEPLPENNPLWVHPRVLITPHVASPTIPAEAAQYVADVIRQIEAGQTPANVVDLSHGY